MSCASLALGSTEGYSSEMIEASRIESMSVTERLELMEQLGETLLRATPEPPSARWDGEVLARRKARAESGEAKFLTLDQLRTRFGGS
jgi:hypothetical protein